MLKKLQINDLAAQVNLSKDTLRFYEAQGLLPKRYVTRHTNGYREYTEDTLERITLIKRMKLAGLTLDEIRDILAKWDAGTLDPETQEALYAERIAWIDNQIAELSDLKKYLQNKLENLRNLQYNVDDCMSNPMPQSMVELAN